MSRKRTFALALTVIMASLIFAGCNTIGKTTSEAGELVSNTLSRVEDDVSNTVSRAEDYTESVTPGRDKNPVVSDHSRLEDKPDSSLPSKSAR